MAAAHEIGVPVALKLSGADVRHKSEAGALALGLMTAGEIEAEARRLLALPESGGAQLLVERMAEPGVELFVAATADGVVPALVVGLGGIWTEVLDDVAIIPLPAEPERIERALRSLRGAPALTGGRGRGPVDLEAVARLASGAGRMLLEAGLALVELNPVVARPDGAVALDAVAARRRGGRSRGTASGCSAFRRGHLGRTGGRLRALGHDQHRLLGDRQQALRNAAEHDPGKRGMAPRADDDEICAESVRDLPDRRRGTADPDRRDLDVSRDALVAQLLGPAAQRGLEVLFPDVDRAASFADRVLLDMGEDEVRAVRASDPDCECESALRSLRAIHSDNDLGEHLVLLAFLNSFGPVRCLAGAHLALSLGREGEPAALGDDDHGPGCSAHDLAGHAADDQTQDVEPLAAEHHRGRREAALVEQRARRVALEHDLLAGDVSGKRVDQSVDLRLETPVNVGRRRDRNHRRERARERLTNSEDPDTGGRCLGQPESDPRRPLRLERSVVSESDQA